MYNKQNSLPVGDWTLEQKRTEAPPCTRMDGSYMAEFAAALPFYAGFMALLLFFFQALTVQQEVGSALLGAGRELSVLACASERGSDAALSIAAQALVQKNLKKSGAAERFIRRGRRGISLMRSDFSGSFIRLQADYEIRFPLALFGAQGIDITQNVVCRKWIGRAAQDSADEEIVYITPAGTVYHKNRGCSYISPSVKSAGKSGIGTLRNENGGIYYPCKRCIKQAGKAPGVVYYTKYGDRYHGKKDCSGLKRTVYAVRRNRAGGRSACSKCGKG